MHTKQSIPLSVALILAFLPQISSRAEKIESMGSYEIHEWGVLAGCKMATNYFNTSRPIRVIGVREPIIYVHSEDGKPFSLKVSFPTGVPTETYPPALITNNSVLWNNVMIAKDNIAVRRSRRSIPRETFVPLKDIMGVLSDTDSDMLIFEGETSRFLFYEGEIPFVSKVTTTVNLTNNTAVIHNAGAFDVHDLILIQPGEQSGPMSFMRQSLVAKIKQLDSKQTVEATLTPLTNQYEFTSQLVDMGFTEKEAVSFNTLWKRPFLQMGNLVYRLSEEECNQVTTLDFDPKPRKCIRALYVVVRP